MDCANGTWYYEPWSAWTSSMDQASMWGELLPGVDGQEALADMSHTGSTEQLR